MSRTVKFAVALVAIVLLWKGLSGGSAESAVEYEPAE